MEAYRTAYVYVRNAFAGTLKETDSGYSFVYDSEYLEIESPTAVSLTLPIQKEEYYYNCLYNKLVMKMNVNELINEYMNVAKQYIDYKNYEPSFVIIKSLVNAFYKVEKILVWNI